MDTLAFVAAEGGRAKVKNIACFRCSKKGHYANKYKVILWSNGSENADNGEEDANKTAALAYADYKDAHELSHYQVMTQAINKAWILLDKQSATGYPA
eukprot:7089675-Ditylum_brightwellii.AAC.1